MRQFWSAFSAMKSASIRNSFPQKTSLIITRSKISSTTFSSIYLPRSLENSRDFFWFSQQTAALLIIYYINLITFFNFIHYQNRPILVLCSFQCKIKYLVTVIFDMIDCRLWRVSRISRSQYEQQQLFRIYSTTAIS